MKLIKLPFLKSGILDIDFCKKITDFVYQESFRWQKDLKNVKALTSGYTNPGYPFMDELEKTVIDNLLPKEYKWKKDWSWINLYKEGDFALPHIHKPHEWSCIIIIKKSNKECLHFIQDNQICFIREKEGLTLLFPSDKIHYVAPCGQSDRITIAMDFSKKE